MKKSIIFLLFFLLIIGCEESEKNDIKSSETQAAFIKTNDADISFSERGSSDTTLLFLHGWGINNSYWDDQINYFGDNYRTVAIDLPGFGKSKTSRKNFTVEKYADDIIDVINQLRLKNVILIGHSMSGDIALETANKNHKEIIGIVGVDNFKYVDVQIPEEQLKEMNKFFEAMKKDYKNVVGNFADASLFHETTDSTDRNRVKEDFVNSDPKAALSSIENVFKYDEPGNLAELNYKLFLINNDGTPTNTEGLKKYCKKSFEVLEIKDTGHYPMIEKPDEFNKLLQEVINSVGKVQ